MECAPSTAVAGGRSHRGCSLLLLARDPALQVVFKAKAVVLATGWTSGRAFTINSNSWECTGDGQALAYLAPVRS